jgi:hypothetical protein
MNSSKLNRTELRKQFKALKLTSRQKKFFNINGNSKNVDLKNFLDSYEPTLKIADYNTIRAEARRLGYNEKEGRTKLKLIDFIETKKNKEQYNILIEELSLNQLNKEIDNLIKGGKYPDLLKLIFKEKKSLSDSQFDRLWSNLINENYVVELKVNNIIQHLTVNSNTYEFFRNLFMNGFIEAGNETYGSDVLDNIVVSEIQDIKINKLKKPKRLLQKDGRFFPYINISELDLSRYQIYNQEQAYENKNKEHCLIHSLRLAGIDEYYLSQIMLSYISGVNIRKKDLKSIVNVIKTNIHLYIIDNNEKVQIEKIRFTGAEPCIKLCLYEGHYFIYEDTIYSKFFISNYDKLINVDNPYMINKIIYNKDKEYYTRGDVGVNSLLLIHKLKKGMYFKKLDLSMFEEMNNIKEPTIYLDNIEEEQELYYEDEGKLYDILFNGDYHKDENGEFKSDNPKEYARAKRKYEAMNNPKIIEKRIFYADCESYVNIQPHRLFMIGLVSDKNDFVNILQVNDNHTENDIVYKFFNNITNQCKEDDKIICYFHNLKYDYHLLEPYLNIKSKVIKDNQIYSVSIRHFEYTIELRDSYKLVPMALNKFQKIFDLDKKFSKKEALAYIYYTPENYGKDVDINEYRLLLKESDKEAFDINMKNEPSKNKTIFNPLEYYKDYLKLDCLVLKKGLENFNKLILEITKNISIYDCLTISSLTDKYMTNNGAYNDVYSICGNLREYVGKAIYGGRVCVNEKYKKKIIKGKISDYDGVSLYPSAINRLCREIGLPTGKAQRLNGQDYRNFKYSILTVKINKVNKKQQMPFIAHKGDGVINYTNEAPVEQIIIDSITLQDYIKFHNIEYEVLDGVYWEGNFNNKMGELVRNLFDERMKYKKEKPALAETIKLMLNSSYGKTIMKKTNFITKMIGQNKDNSLDNNFEDYIYNNFRTIKSYRQVNNYNYEVESICIDNSYNRGHIGCAILSMSKRLMNEVFDIANDNNYPIYYTDTDSLHCNLEDVKPLEDKYREIYGKELNGKNLEQFHTDFKLDGAVEEIYATKSIFLGKKSYLDCLESKDKDGNTIKGFHIRLKGITEAGLEYEANKYEKSYEGLYDELCEGKEINMLLNPKDKVLFKFNKGNVETKSEFFRKVKF